MNDEMVGTFSMKRYRSIIKLALEHGYHFPTMNEFVTEGCKYHSQLVLRHDLTERSSALRQMLDVEREMGVKSTTFVRLAGAEYNYLSYDTYDTLKAISWLGSEIGLLTSCVEFVSLMGGRHEDVLGEELRSLRGHFDVNGLACHKNASDTLLYVHANQPELIKSHGLRYVADKLGGTKLISDALSLDGWQTSKPEDVIQTGQSVCLQTHPYMWWNKHPFEAQQ